jgi:hypothetical protein
VRSKDEARGFAEERGITTCLELYYNGDLSPTTTRRSVSPDEYKGDGGLSVTVGKLPQFGQDSRDSWLITP